MKNEFFEEEDEALENVDVQQKIVDYVNELHEVQIKKEALSDHLKDVKADYIDNGWLTKDQMKLANKAYRLNKSGFDLGKLKKIQSIIDGEDDE